MKINPFQKALLQNYEAGQFANIVRAEDLRTCGDPLLIALMQELDDTCYYEAQAKHCSPSIMAGAKLLAVVTQVSAIHKIILKVT